jgi:hypothetical protein
MKKIMLFNAIVLTLSINLWAVDPVPQKGQLQQMYEKFNGQIFGSPMIEKIKEAKKLALPPAEQARQIRVILENYLEPGPTKVVANDICSAQGPKFNAYFKNEVFSFSEIQNSTSQTSESTHTTQIRYKKSVAKEKEDFVQVGTTRVSKDGTYSYAFSDGEKETQVPGAKTLIHMLDQFVKTRVMPQRDDKISLQESDHALLTTELEQAWKFFKRVGACCAESECKSALRAQISLSPKLGNRPYSTAPGQAGAK